MILSNTDDLNQKHPNPYPSPKAADISINRITSSIMSGSPQRPHTLTSTQRNRNNTGSVLSAPDFGGIGEVPSERNTPEKMDEEMGRKVPVMVVSELVGDNRITNELNRQGVHLELPSGLQHIDDDGAASSVLANEKKIVCMDRL